MSQIFYLGGGEAKENFDGDYYDFLRAQTYDPYAKKFTNWKQVFRDTPDITWISVPFPNEGFADYTAWKIVWKSHLNCLKDGDTIITCSLGGGFLLKYATENPNLPIKLSNLIFLAPGWRDTPDEVIGEFAPDLTKLPDLNAWADQIHILHSNDDTVVPIADSVELHTKHLPYAELHTLKNHGHFYMMERIEVLENLLGV